MHPSFDILGSKGSRLSGRFIVLAVTGSIACVKAFELCRELMRQRAVVKVVMSKEATRIITPEAMHYASGLPAVTEITGAVEHIEYFGKGGSADLLLIAPATANTISKIAQGIDDTPVTTFATTAIGSKKPLLAVPAMHHSMYSHPVLQENIKKLNEIGINFLEPKIEEGKAKFPDTGEIVLEAARILNLKNNSKLKNKKILITAGALREHLDPVRFISTASSGLMGVELAKAAYAQGASVTVVGNKELLEAHSSVKSIPIINATNFSGMEKAVLQELKSKKYDYSISAAAIPDFSVKKQKNKIKSNKKIKLELTPNKKLISEVRKKSPKLKIVAFKAETNKTTKEMEKIGKSFMKKNKLQLVVVNDVAKGTIGRKEAELVVVSNYTHSRTLTGPKPILADTIISLLP